MEAFESSIENVPRAAVEDLPPADPASLLQSAWPGLPTHKTVELKIRPPQNTVHQADFREHGYAEYHYRQEDFNTHDPSKEDLETANDIGRRRFDFMTPFQPETAHFALKDYQDSLKQYLLPTPPPTELLDTLVTVLQSTKTLETLRLRISPPEQEVIEHFHRAFSTANLSLPSTKSLHLSPGTHFLATFTPNANSITSIGVFNTTSALSFIHSASNTIIEHLALRTRWDERKLQAIIHHCSDLTTLHMLASTGNGQVLKWWS